MKQNVMDHHVHRARLRFADLVSQPFLVLTHGTDPGSCCNASTLCSACNATVAQEYANLAKASKPLPNDGFEPFPLHRQLVAYLLARKQSDRVCLQGVRREVEVIA